MGTERLMWTIAYRKPTGPHFHRVSLALTWRQARLLASRFGEANPGMQVWYTTTREHDEQCIREWAAVDFAPDTLEASYAEDAHNIMVNSGRRVKVVDNGKLSKDIQIPTDAEAEAAWK